MVAGVKKFIRIVLSLRHRHLDVRVQESVATLGTIAVLLLLPAWVWWYQVQHIPESYPEGAKVFNVTGVGSEGRWTLQAVGGYNYWWKSFSAAAVQVDEGDLVVLRLMSSDVTHVFYAPTLGVGPVSIEPGHVEVVMLRAKDAGIHEYYCLSVCGECHYFMRGHILVRGGDNRGVSASFSSLPYACQHELEVPSGSSLYERGERLFQKLGCVTCHGERGKGGVPNPNYIKGTVPALNRLARTIALVDEQAAEEFVRLIEDGKSADEMVEMSTDIPRQSLVLAKYEIVRDVIAKGRHAARADTTSFDPPLSMPMWRQKLSQRDIDALVVYLLKQQSWEGNEE